MTTKFANWTVLSAFSLLFYVSVTSIPVEKSSGTSSSSSVDKYSGPVMVAVSSTVIPLLHLFGKPKPLQSSSNQQVPRRSSALYLSPERRARLFERSHRPDAPVRLITKNSKGKDLNNETH